jgi:hypothetical protein
VVAAGPVVCSLLFLRVVATTPLPVASEHHRDVGVLYSHSVTTDGAPALISLRTDVVPARRVSILYLSARSRPPAPRNTYIAYLTYLEYLPFVYINIL